MRLLSEAGFGASSWLRAIPVKFDLQIGNLDYRICCQWWLHLPLLALLHSPAQCDCGKLKDMDGRHAPFLADPFGDHDLVCRKADTLTRHNYVGAALVRLARLVGLSARQANVVDMRRRLPDGRVDPTDTSKRQPDVVWDDWHTRATPLLVDVVLSHPTAASHIDVYNRSVVAGAVAAKAESGKRGRYADQVQGKGLAFAAFGVETYGAWGPSAVAVLGQLKAHARAAGGLEDTRQQYGWCAPQVTEAARQTVAVARMRGIASALRRSAAERRRGRRLCDYTDAAMSEIGRQTQRARVRCQQRQQANRRVILAAQRDARAPPPPESVMLEDPAAPAAHPPALLFADVRADLLEPAFDTSGLEEPAAANTQQEAACPPLVSGGGGGSSHVPGLPAAPVAPNWCGRGHGDMGGEAVVPPALVRGPAPRISALPPHALLLLLFLVCVLVLVSCAAVVGLSVVPALPVGAPSGVAIVASGSAWVSCCALLLLCYFV